MLAVSFCFNDDNMFLKSKEKWGALHFTPPTKPSQYSDSPFSKFLVLLTISRSYAQHARLASMTKSTPPAPTR